MGTTKRHVKPAHADYFKESTLDEKMGQKRKIPLPEAQFGPGGAYFRAAGAFTRPTRNIEDCAADGIVPRGVWRKRLTGLEREMERVDRKIQDLGLAAKKNGPIDWAERRQREEAERTSSEVRSLDVWCAPHKKPLGDDEDVVVVEVVRDLAGKGKGKGKGKEAPRK
jgi:hypothetical protein